MILDAGLWMPVVDPFSAGGSDSRGMLKLIAQVFAVPVQAFEISDGAAFGAAIRAATLWVRNQGEVVDQADLCRKLAGADRFTSVETSREETAVFRGEDGLLKVYTSCEDFHLANGPDPQPLIDRYRKRYG